LKTDEVIDIFNMTAYSWSPGCVCLSVCVNVRMAIHRCISRRRRMRLTWLQRCWSTELNPTPSPRWDVNHTGTDAGYIPRWFTHPSTGRA